MSVQIYTVNKYLLDLYYVPSTVLCEPNNHPWPHPANGVFGENGKQVIKIGTLQGEYDVKETLHKDDRKVWGGRDV